MPPVHSAPQPARQVLRDGVHERVLDLLLDGTYSAGDRLSIDGLARRLDVSPTPVREALATLENTGLIQREALRGYRVAPPLTVSQLNDLMDARRTIELAAVEKAMSDPAGLARELRPVHQEDVRVVRNLGLDAEEQPVGFSGYREYFQADWAFHSTILRMSGNSYLFRMGDSLGFQAHRLRQAFGTGSVDAHEAVEEHAEILRKVEAGDGAGAVAAMADHLERVRHRCLGDAGDRESAKR